MKTAEEILKEAIANYNKGVSDFRKFLLSDAEIKMFTDAMEEYRKQGDHFTPEEIAQVQATAYDAGWSAGSDAMLFR